MNPMEPLMTVGPEDVYRCNSRSLATLLRLPESCDDMFTPAELGQVLEHQLRVAITADLRPGDGDWDEAAMARHNPPIRNWADLLFHDHPPVPVLLAAKAFAKPGQQGSQTPLPLEIAHCLYYGAIAAAFLRHGQLITTLATSDLMMGFQMLLNRAWLAPRLRDLFMSALTKLDKE